MPEPSRAERRRDMRGNAATPPPRDPMRPIYIGVGVLVVVIIAVFALLRWQQNVTAARLTTFDTTTPTPGPSASTKPIKLVDGGTIGAQHFQDGNSPAGGQGDSVDGISCLGVEGQALHIHSHLAIFDQGKQMQVPRYVGMKPTVSGGCLYWIHTHDYSGIIHVETPDVVAPEGNGQYTLGMLFDIWGEPLGPNGVAGFDGPVTAYVNGAPYSGDLRSIPLISHQQIVLEVGTPVVPPPRYTFPPND
jgi:hypothetical protein